jgi:hypothetical protein
MSNLVVFRREANPETDETDSVNRPVAIAGKDWSRSVEAQFSRSQQGRKPALWATPAVIKRSGLLRIAVRAAQADAQIGLDAHLLMLLADQELVAGRDQQAEALLDAAFAAYDRKTHGRSIRPGLAG